MAYFFVSATVKPRANSLGTCTQNTHELRVHERRAITLYPGAAEPLASVCASHRPPHTHTQSTLCCNLHPPRRHSHKRTHNNNCSPLPLHRLSPPPLFLFLLLSSALLSPHSSGAPGRSGAPPSCSRLRPCWRASSCACRPPPRQGPACGRPRPRAGRRARRAPSRTPPA